MSKSTTTITLTVEWDPEAWSDTYDVNANDQPEDVRDYLRNQIEASAASDECGLSVTTIKVVL